MLQHDSLVVSPWIPLVNINCGRVEISLKKEVQHIQWESIGTFLDGHCKLSPKAKRGTKKGENYVYGILV